MQKKREYVRGNSITKTQITLKKNRNLKTSKERRPDITPEPKREITPEEITPEKE